MIVDMSFEFDVQVTVHRDKFLYFGNKTLHVSDSSSVHHQEFFAVHTAMVYVIEQQDQDGSVLILLTRCKQTCMTYNIAVCTVKNS